MRRRWARWSILEKRLRISYEPIGPRHYSVVGWIPPVSRGTFESVARTFDTGDGVE
jgi:hypothetical protein